MPTSTAIGYNTGSTINGTQQIGNLAVVTATTANPSSSPNGVRFWMGPDEDLGYVVGLPVPQNNQSTPIGGVNASLGFIRSDSFTQASFLSMVNSIFNQNFTTGDSAKSWLNSNGYWTSWGKATYPLDTYSGDTAAYSLRKLSATYSGSAIRVRRSSDNSEQDIGFVGNELDTSSLTSFVGAGTGTVVTWYDQSGNNANAVQNGSVPLPRIVVSGTLQQLNGKPAISFDGTMTMISSVFSGFLGPNNTAFYFGVGSASDTQTRLMLMTGGSGVNAQAIRRNGNFLQSIGYNNAGVTIFTDGGSVNVGTSQFIACSVRNVTSIEIFTNNQSDGATTSTGTADGFDRIVIGSFNPSVPNFTWNGFMQELLVYGVSPSTNSNYRNDITTLLNSYYNTY